MGSAFVVSYVSPAVSRAAVSVRGHGDQTLLVLSFLVSGAAGGDDPQSPVVVTSTMCVTSRSSVCPLCCCPSTLVPGRVLQWSKEASQPQPAEGPEEPVSPAPTLGWPTTGQHPLAVFPMA